MIFPIPGTYILKRWKCFQVVSSYIQTVQWGLRLNEWMSRKKKIPSKMMWIIWRQRIWERNQLSRVTVFVSVPSQCFCHVQFLKAEYWTLSIILPLRWQISVNQAISFAKAVIHLTEETRGWNAMGPYTRAFSCLS